MWVTGNPFFCQPFCGMWAVHCQRGLQRLVDEEMQGLADYLVARANSHSTQLWENCSPLSHSKSRKINGNYSRQLWKMTGTLVEDRLVDLAKILDPHIHIGRVHKVFAENSALGLPHLVPIY